MDLVLLIILTEFDIGAVGERLTQCFRRRAVLLRGQVRSSVLPVLAGWCATSFLSPSEKLCEISLAGRCLFLEFDPGQMRRLAMDALFTPLLRGTNSAHLMSAHLASQRATIGSCTRLCIIRRCV